MRRADLKAHLTEPGHEDETTGQWIDDARVDNVWNPSRGDDDPKNKQVATVPLSALAQAVLATVPQLSSEYVFSLDGKNPTFQSRYKAQLDARLKAALAAQGVEFRPWQYRDLRRTAKTLMRRAGVSRDVSERCLAHVIRGVEGVYDRHDYLREKRDAFDRLAALVERIVNPPPPANVVPIQTLPTRRQAGAAP
jgi:integrase